MALNLSMEKGFYFSILLFGFSVASEADRWLHECKNAQIHGQKECLILGENNARITVNKSIVENADRMFVLCHQGWEKEWYRLWLNPRIKVIETEPNQDFQFFYGSNLTDVKNTYKSSILNIWSLMRIKEEFSLSPFNVSCLGIVSSKKYSVDFKVKNPELWYIAFLIAGIVIFFSARSWSRNVALQYSTGISLGVLASILIVVFILNRIMPQKLKTLGYGILLLGGSASMFIIQKIGNQFHDIIQNHWQIAVGYVLVTGLLSFAAVYKFGPITDSKTLNLVRWSLQLVGIIFMYIGTQIPEASVAIIIVVLTVYNFPRRVIQGLKSFKYRFFRPKIRLLTEDEYITQGQIETKKALEELRSFCQSPECDSWRVVSRLKNPVRFARFVEGDSHIDDSELLEHDSFADFEPPEDMSDDESETDFRLSTP